MIVYQVAQLYYEHKRQALKLYAGINFTQNYPPGTRLEGSKVPPPRDNHCVQKPFPRDKTGSQKPHPWDIK